MTSTTRELDRLTFHQARIENLLELPADQLQAASSISEWSAAKQLFHVTLANELSLKNIASLVAEKGLLIRPLEPLDPRVTAILERGRFPSGAEAPRFVRPPDKVDLDLLRELAGDVRAALNALEGTEAAIDAAPDSIPHQRLGTLTAAQWARFARMHAAHHLLIVRRILAATQ